MRAQQTMARHTVRHRPKGLADVAGHTRLLSKGLTRRINLGVRHVWHDHRGGASVPIWLATIRSPASPILRKRPLALQPVGIGRVVETKESSCQDASTGLAAWLMSGGRG
jgi:hypothetical protein